MLVTSKEHLLSSDKELNCLALAEMIMLTIHPFNPEDRTSKYDGTGKTTPFIRQIESRNGRIGFFCHWHQFVIWMNQANDRLEFFPDWNSLSVKSLIAAEAKEKAIADLHSDIFTYIQGV